MQMPRATILHVSPLFTKEKTYYAFSLMLHACTQCNDTMYMDLMPNNEKNIEENSLHFEDVHMHAKLCLCEYNL